MTYIDAAERTKQHYLVPDKTKKKYTVSQPTLANLCSFSFPLVIGS